MVSLGIFSVVPPTEPCALRSTQPLKVSTRDFFWGKGGRYVWLTTYHACSAETSRKSGALTYPEPLGPPRPVAGHLYLPPEDGPLRAETCRSDIQCCQSGVVIIQVCIRRHMFDIVMFMRGSERYKANYSF